MDCKTLMARLTLEEKCALLTGKGAFVTRGYPHKDIPGMLLADGPHGLRKQSGASGDHLGIKESEPATCFPTAAAVANSWDPELGEEIGRALGREAAAQGVSVVLGPGLNIKRSPLGGRNFEYFSEDPYLSGKLAAGYIRGIQSQGIAACPKHFAVNSQETRRLASDSVLDERTLRELYLTGFEIAVQEGKPWCLMTSYNKVNGVYASENEHLLREVLRGEWGYRGAVVTDWGGSNDHALAVKNTSTLEMPAAGGDSVRELLAAVQSGRITEADIDARVEELLTLALRTRPAVKNAAAPDAGAHHELARRAAAESLVLLKNRNDLLPLAAGTATALIGDFARTPRYQGAGSSLVHPTRLDTLEGALAQSGLRMTGWAQGFHRDGTPDPDLLEEAVSLAKDAQAVILCLGLDETVESEGFDRTHMRLAENQVRLLETVSQVNPRVAVVLQCGCAVETPWLDCCGALLYACLGGQAGAGAAADVLTGKLCPGGKLAETWPLTLADTSTAGNFPSRDLTAEYREGLYVGYRYDRTAKIPVRFPFGYGLSYTTFEYADLEASADGVTFTLTNTGERAGTEIAQLYVSRPDGQVFRPALELKGFVRVTQKAGESIRVRIPLDEKAFRYWNTVTDRWETEGGTYRLLVGASCADLRLQADLPVPGTGAPDPYAGLPLDSYRTGRVQKVPDDQFAALLGRPIPPSCSKAIDRDLIFGDLHRTRSPLGWLLGLILKKLEEKNGADMTMIFIRNMPLRAAAKLTGGGFSMGMVDAMAMELRGFWIIGLLRLLWENVKNRRANAALEKRLQGPKK